MTMKKFFLLVLAALMMVASWRGFFELEDVVYRFFMFVSAMAWMAATFIALTDICHVRIPLLIEEEWDE